MTKIGLVVASFAVALAVQAQEPKIEAIQLGRYDKSFGLPQIGNDGGATFKKSVSVSGQIRIERDDADYCEGACAYFAPDAATLKRLPQRIVPGTNRVSEAQDIELFVARQILLKTLGEKRTKEILSRSLTVYSAPATATLNNFRVYFACGRTHYEADIVTLSVSSASAQRSGTQIGGGC